MNRSNWMDTTRQAFTTNDASRSMAGVPEEELHDETSDDHTTDSEEGIAEGQYRNRWHAMKRRNKRGLCEDLIDVVADDVALVTGDEKKTGDRQRHAVQKKGPLIMVITSLVLTLVGLFLDYEDTGGFRCMLSYIVLSLVMTLGQSYYLVEMMRDGAVRPHNHGALAPEVHFLAGNIPGALATTRIASFAGFVLGLLGVLFAILFMESIGLDTKFYMFLCTLFVLTTALALWVQWRDEFDASIWRDEVVSEAHRSILSSRVEHALRNIHNGQTHTTYLLKGIYFFSMLFCMIILVLMFLWFSVQTKHVGLMFGLTAFMLALGWFFGKWINRSIADSYANVRTTTASINDWVVIGFALCVTATMIVVFVALDFGGFHRKFTLAVALLCLLNSCMNFSKVAHKSANIKLLLETLSKRLNTTLEFGDRMDLYDSVFAQGGGGGNGRGQYQQDPGRGGQYAQDPYGGHGGHADQGGQYAQDPYGGQGQQQYHDQGGQYGHDMGQHGGGY